MRGPTSQILGPILDTYRGSALAIVGCHAKGVQRNSCELDVLVVTNERRPNVTIKIGGVFIDLFFATEAETLKPTNPEHAVSMAHAKTVKDSSLLLSTSITSSVALLQSNSRRSSVRRLASALKALGRAEEALIGRAMVDADYWLLSATYDCAYSWLYSREVTPSPSHLLSQLKTHSEELLKSFVTFSKGAGLGSSSRKNCNTRLDALGVLYDVLGGRYVGTGNWRLAWSNTRFRSVGLKVKELGAKMEHAECYSFLGTEVLNALKQITLSERTRLKEHSGPSTLTSGASKLFGEKLLAELGLVRERDTLEESIELLRAQISKLARRA